MEVEAPRFWVLWYFGLCLSAISLSAYKQKKKEKKFLMAQAERESWRGGDMGHVWHPREEVLEFTCGLVLLNLSFISLFTQRKQLHTSREKDWFDFECLGLVLT